MSDPAGRSTNRKRTLVHNWPVMATLVALLALSMGLASLGYPRTMLDSPSSTVIGGVILEGGIPYRDAWDLRAPGVYFAYALNIALFGKSAVTMRVFDLLWQTGTALVIMLIVQHVVRQRSAALLAAGLYLLGYYSQHYSTWVQPDGFLNLPMALSCWFGLRAFESDRIGEWGAAAFALGIAALFKLPFGLFGIALLGASLALPASPGRKISRMAALAAGLGAAFLACLVYFWSGGALQDLLDAQFRFAPAYVERIHSVVTFRDVLAQFSRPVLIPFFVLLAMSLGSLPWAMQQRQYAVMLLAWLASCVFTILVQGSYLLYHLHPFLPPLALLAAPYLAATFGVPATGGRWLRILFGAGFVVLALTAGAKLFLDARFSVAEFNADGSSDIWREPGLAIKERTAPDETIFVWGNVPALYVHADRRAACRFLPTAFLSIEVPGLDYRGICLDDLARNRPIYIVLAPQGPVTPGLDDTMTSFEAFPDLVSLVAAEYELQERNELYLLYRRKADGPAGGGVQ